MKKRKLFRTLLGLLFFAFLFSCDKDSGSSAIVSKVNIDEKLYYKDVTSRKIADGYFITSIAFDKEGNAWLGTFEQGLIKYNDQETICYDSSNSIITNDAVINSIAVDSKNNVWIGSDGLIKYNGKKFHLYNSKNSPIPEDHIHSINIDSKDNIWFSSSRYQLGGLVRYDGTDNWKVFTPKNSKLPGNMISGIAVAGNDVWVGLNEYVNDARIAKITNDNVTVYSNKQLGFSPYYLGNLCVNSKNQLYVNNDYSLSSMMYNESPNIFSFDGKSTQLIDCTHGDINYISIDRKDNIWCISPLINYILVFDGHKWLAYNIFPEGVNDGIFCIEEAPDGSMWIGTGNGLYIVDPE